MATAGRKRKKLLPIILGMVIFLYLVLLIPDTDEPTENLTSAQTPHKPFVWNQDAYWDILEAQFVSARQEGCEKVTPTIDSLLALTTQTLSEVSTKTLDPRATQFHGLELCVFELSPFIAACPERFTDFAKLISQMRNVVKRQSVQWDMTSVETRTTLYRLLYGSRHALEEIMLQLPAGSKISNLTVGIDEPSETPSANILGVPVHSGDILISRGGVPTSALIARGNDFPGNFSHAALLHVNPETHVISIIESHIERGVTISTIENYLKDKKLRVMVLRPRSDLPQIAADPILPHKTAERALQRAKSQHIPYDFAMDFEDSTKWFCSEVVSDVYRHSGIRLWMGLSHISAPGLRVWLAGFGVRNFVTQEPSDLEYDPQLHVVAEWRDMETLRKDHYDNAVTEVLLDGADVGEPLQYSLSMLPLARAMKAYSVLLNMFGAVGPIPEGMPATAALRNRWYTGIHDEITKKLVEAADRFQREKGFVPPYWELLKMARIIKRTIDPPLLQ